MHLSSAQSRSAWTEQEDDLLRAAVKKYGDRAWATVANDVPGRSSKSCSDRWRNFLSPDIEHPRKSPFSEWEVAVVVQAQHRYGNNWKAISMLLPGRTNRAVKNLFVGNLKWGARLPEIQNRYLENKTPLEDLLEITPDYPGGPPKERPGLMLGPGPRHGGFAGASAGLVAATTSSAGSAWASEVTEQQLHVAGGAGASPLGGGLQLDPQRLRRPREASEGGSPSACLHTPEAMHKRLRTGASPQTAGPHHCGGETGAAPLGLAVPGLMGGMGMAGMPTFGGDIAVSGLTPIGTQYGHSNHHAVHHPLQHPPHLQTLQHPQQHGFCSASPSPTSAATAAAVSPQPISPASDHTHAGLALRAGNGSTGGLGGDGDHPLLLQGHASSDSVMLASIMDTLLEDDELLSDPAIGQHLLGSPTASPLLHAGISAGGAALPHTAPAGGAAAGWGHPAAAAGLVKQEAVQSGQPEPLRSPAAAAHSGDWWNGAQGQQQQQQQQQGQQQQNNSQPQPQPQSQQQQQQPQMMRALCAQLQQENMLLMQQVQSLQTRLAGAPADPAAVSLPAL